MDASIDEDNFQTGDVVTHVNSNVEYPYVYVVVDCTKDTIFMLGSRGTFLELDRVMHFHSWKPSYWIKLDWKLVR